jgi:hypothetical protein
MVSNRVNDHKQEGVINQFLLKNFFKKMYQDVEVVYDTQRQLQGIDIVADGNLIDIKAQSSARYLNNPTNTFILELSFLSSNKEETVGWFLKPDIQTTAYAFVWIHKTKEVNGMILNPNDIEEVEILLVDKKTLKQKINQWRTDDELLGVSRWMRQTATRSKECTLDGIKKLSHTPELFEKPSNLVVQKWFLQQFSLGHYIVTKTSIQKID